MKVLLASVLVILAVLVAFALLSLLLWWLIPIAFPALAFSFGQAMATAGLTLVIWLPMRH